MVQMGSSILPEAHWSGKEERTSVSIAGSISVPSDLVINEVYPEPGHDLNGDGNVNTLDEFIEILNPTNFVYDLTDHSVEDNYDSHSFGPGLLGPESLEPKWGFFGMYG